MSVPQSFIDVFMPNLAPNIWFLAFLQENASKRGLPLGEYALELGIVPPMLSALTDGSRVAKHYDLPFFRRVARATGTPLLPLLLLAGVLEATDDVPPELLEQTQAILIELRRAGGLLT